jgi:DegV family protein with EDD domain
MSIKIYTDASSNLFKDILDEKKVEVTVLPMLVEIGDLHYLCYSDDIDVKKFSTTFYQMMKDGQKPKTSLPNPGLFEEKMEEEIKNGNKVLYISIAGGISGTYQTCHMVADQLNEKYKGDYIHVINSKTAGLGEGRIVLYAYEEAKKEEDFDILTKKVEDYVGRVRSEFVVDSLNYLMQTGRVSAFKAKMVSLLSIKPLLYGSDEGKIEVTSLAHGKLKAIKKLAGQVVEHISDKTSKVYISHCNAMDDALRLKDLLHEEGIDNIEIYFYDFVTGAHVGPGTVAVFYEGENRKI